MKRIDPPLVGIWPFCRCAGCAPPRDFPSVVDLDGRTFRRSKMTERRPGIVAQYREHRARESMHLHVLADGTWRIDHVDAFNPDVGIYSALRHFLADHPLGWIISRR